MENGRQDSGYDEVRARLRERGYLQGPIERFVLGEALAGRAAGVAIAAAAAALLGAPLLAALLAGVVVAVNRPLLGAADALLLWVYSGLASFVVLFVLDALSAAVSLAFATRAGSGRGGGIRAAAVVAFPVLGYLGMLWWTRGPGLGTLGDVLFLAGAVVVTWIVGSLARLVSWAAMFRRTGDLPARGRRGLRVLVGVSVIVALVFLVLPRTLVGGGAGVPPSPFEPAPDDARTILLGLDGLDGELIEALGPSGAVDGLIGTLAAGTVVPVARPAGGAPPAGWTTLMTGVTPAEHGVLDGETERLPGISTPLRPGAGPVPLGAVLRFLLPSRTAPVSGEARGVRAVWEVVGLERPVAAVGWWASWPAERPEAGGYVVSDRVLAKLLSGAEPESDTDPESLFARLRSDFARERQAIRDRFEDAFASVAAAPIRSLAWDSYLIDAHALTVLDHLMADPDVRFGAAYLPGLDILRRRLAEVASAGGPVRDFVAGTGALEVYVGWLSESIQAASNHDGGRLVLVGDPGRSADGQAEGFVAVIGPGAAPACVVSAAIRPVDVAPTILRALGFPRSRDMGDADVHDGCLIGVPANPPTVASFGRRPVRERPRASAVDEELLERLRTLGYVD